MRIMSQRLCLALAAVSLTTMTAFAQQPLTEKPVITPAQKTLPSADRLGRALQTHGIEFETGEFHGWNQHNFKLNGVDCRIVSPKSPAEGKPWVWRARFWGHQPQFDRAMLERGWHVCFCDVSDLFGADPALKRWDSFYEFSQKLGLHSKPFMEGMSRGGLIMLRWATAHPQQVCGIYADNAVMDIRSWPGGKGMGRGSAGDWAKCLKAYQMSDEQSLTFKDGPLNRLKPLADAHVPILALVNEADKVVPPSENSDRLVAAYATLGGPIQQIRRPGLGHHPHSLKDPTVIVEFAINSLRNSAMPKEKQGRPTNATSD